MWKPTRQGERHMQDYPFNLPITDDDEGGYDDVWPARISSSAKRYQELEEEFPDLPIRQAPTQGREYSAIPQRRSAPPSPRPNLPPGVVIIRGVPCTNIGGQW